MQKKLALQLNIENPGDIIEEDLPVYACDDDLERSILFPEPVLESNLIEIEEEPEEPKSWFQLLKWRGHGGLFEKAYSKGNERMLNLIDEFNNCLIEITLMWAKKQTTLDSFLNPNEVIEL